MRRVIDTLRPLAACHISEKQRDAWIRAFLPRHEPFFLRGEPLVSYLLQAGMPVYTWSEFRASFPDFFLAYGSNYQLWDVSQDTYVWMASATQRLHIDAELWQEILKDQVYLLRGQVYDENWYLRLQAEQTPGNRNDGGWQNLLYSCRTDDQVRHFILTHDVWITLPRMIQEAWLLQWLNDQLVNDEVTPVDPHTIPLPASHQPLVLKYNGCFAETSGANCFAATLAMALGTLVRAEQTITLWLHQEPFLRALRVQNYHPVHQIYSGGKIDMIEPLDVLIWSGKDGQMVHASFCVAPGYVFNKMGQSWEQPWLVLRIEDILDYAEVVSQGGKVLLYRKLASPD